MENSPSEKKKKNQKGPTGDFHMAHAATPYLSFSLLSLARSLSLSGERLCRRPRLSLPLPLLVTPSSLLFSLFLLHHCRRQFLFLYRPSA